VADVCLSLFVPVCLPFSNEVAIILNIMRL